MRLTSKSGLSVKTYILSHAAVESQAIQDLAKYRGASTQDVNLPLDIDQFVESVFDVRVEYESIPQPTGVEVLGYYDPANQRIVCDPEVCNSTGRINFTIAHEAGHISLHTCLVAGASLQKWRDIQKHSHIEWQANAYAGYLIAPTPLVMDLLSENGVGSPAFQSEGVDMDLIAPLLTERFGLSRHAGEIRVHRLGYQLKNNRNQIE